MRRSCALLLIAFPIAAMAGEQLPVWYSSGQMTKADIQSEYHKPLHTFDRKPLRMVKNVSGDGVQIKTCEEYLIAIRQGYHAPGNYENKHELLFIDTCYNLNYLKKARPAVTSYFPDQALPENPLDTLSPILPNYFKSIRVLDDKSTWREQDPQLVVLKFDGKPLQLEDEDNYYDIQVKVAGDLNGDGVEDLAGFDCQTARQGSDIECKAFVVTRCGPDKIIRRMSGSSPPFAIDESSKCNAIGGSEAPGLHNFHVNQR